MNQVKVKRAALEYLINENNTKEKTKNVKYKNLKLQNYFKSSRFTNTDIEVLIKLRSKTLDVKANFPKQHFNNIVCRMQNCLLNETQEHIYSDCVTLNKSVNQKDIIVPYKDIFSKSVKKQSEVTKRFVNLLKARSEIMESK